MIDNIDTFFETESQWQKEYVFLRKLILTTDVEEAFKWGKPCYTYDGANIVLMHGFKEYCALLFPKGVLLKDEDDLLVQQTKNVQSARQLRFKNLKEIKKIKEKIKEYIYEAIEVEKQDLKVEMKKTSEYEVPEELQTAFQQDADFQKAFKKLTPGRQRGYLLYFSGAKQSKTRQSRIDKYKPQILEGKGLND